MKLKLFIVFLGILIFAGCYRTERVVKEETPPVSRVIVETTPDVIVERRTIVKEPY